LRVSSPEAGANSSAMAAPAAAPATNQSRCSPVSCAIVLNPPTNIVAPAPRRAVAGWRPAVMLGTMNGQPDMVTVYRSMDASAEADCEIVMDLLATEGIEAVMLDDDSPGVPEGAYEVQVRAKDVSRAEGIIAANPLPDDE